MLPLRVAFSPNPRLRPLLDGTVKVPGLELEFELGQPGAMFHRHLQLDEFDVFEFSISDYLIARQKPHLRDRRWTAIPIFLSRAFLSLNTCVNVGSGIDGFADLKGKRFGLPDYTMTAALWMRAMINELYGIRPTDIAWYLGRSHEVSHAVDLGVHRDPPPGLSLTWLDRGDALNQMLHAGDIDAAYGDSAPDRDGGVPITEGTRVKRLFAQDGGRGFITEFVSKTGFTPVNHTVLVQQRLVEKEPWLAMALFDAFEQSKQEAYHRDPGAYVLFKGDDPDRQAATFGPDPYPSGLAANRPMLAMGAQQSLKEGLTHQLTNVDELFWETVRST